MNIENQTIQKKFTSEAMKSLKQLSINKNEPKDRKVSYFCLTLPNYKFQNARRKNQNSFFIFPVVK